MKKLFTLGLILITSFTYANAITPNLKNHKVHLYNGDGKEISNFEITHYYGSEVTGTLNLDGTKLEVLLDNTNRVHPSAVGILSSCDPLIYNDLSANRNVIGVSDLTLSEITACAEGSGSETTDVSNSKVYRIYRDHPITGYSEQGIQSGFSAEEDPVLTEDYKNFFASLKYPLSIK